MLTPTTERFLISRCGYLADWFPAAELEAKLADGWTDCTDMTDADMERLMVTRMRAAEERKRALRLEARAERAQWHRDYDLCRI